MVRVCPKCGSTPVVSSTKLGGAGKAFTVMCSCGSGAVSQSAKKARINWEKFVSLLSR